VHQKQAKGDLYIGTDVGVYHKDNTMNDWVPYMNNLPNVVVNELEINYNTQKIVAATFGRGVWESGLNTNSTYVNNIGYDIQIYPNPTEDIVTIQGLYDNSFVINIYNITGKKVFSSISYSNKISLKNLSKGCYAMEIVSNNLEPIIKKLIIK
jgi:hypothetical protein